ncbi:Low specificity L-threonine aldolase [Oxobacter pfennigii]|uniref:Low specificity L-threonine aldolase n=1 Tax=Oxobacter pfennigii TaxID=36849 RepID=A0A0P9AJR8_9CLOT|nr:aminotransferase class I/II-fold pyridoxal phosphate-dependent enzyme [Oxobacter pfennigii]KPU45637.1 Low specificity L-threonine aldolase [Oxobacter pfennigii]
MYSFRNDYSEGAHPRILEALVNTNLIQTEGYGEDIYTLEAIENIKNHIGSDDVQIHLISGGTQVNLIAISAFLRPHEAAITASSGHIAVHETGAIEATGHKVITVDVSDGKLNPSHIKSVLDVHTDEHMVKPKLVYISNSTEVGTIYSKKELYELSTFCRDHNLILFMDGARLGSALCSYENDLKLNDIKALVDAFYIGGTKNGALLGEVLVIVNSDLKEDFRYHIKQKGALLAKGRLLGIQFKELFKDDLFFSLAKHANSMADILRGGIEKAGFTFLTCSPSNQLFPVLPDCLIKELEKKYAFNTWAKIDDNTTAIRLVTSWATEEKAVLSFIDDLKNLMSR